MGAGFRADSPDLKHNLNRSDTLCGNAQVQPGRSGDSVARSGVVASMQRLPIRDGARSLAVVVWLTVLTVLTVIAGPSACSKGSLDLTDPRTVASELRGTWNMPETFPGVGYGFTIAVTDTTVTGTGTFSIEAGPSGTLAVTGTVDGTIISLTFVSSIGQTQHFIGSFRDVNTLTGAFWTESSVASDPVPVTFVRATQ